MFKQIANWAGQLVAVIAVGVLLWSAKANWAALRGWTITPLSSLVARRGGAVSAAPPVAT